jgi:uncharacterized protein (DUF1800 family)
MTAAIALNRFGLGAKPGKGHPANPKAHLLDQLQSYNPRPPELAALPSRAILVETFKDYQADRRDARMEKQAQAADMKPTDGVQLEKMVNTVRAEYVTAANARIVTALTSDTGFAERLVHFWSNHFAVSIDKLTVVGLAGDYEFQAIRPNIMGKFSDLLFASVRHPAMLMYLDQAQSIGPNSPLATRVAERRNKQFGLNENLAREILELHTLGVRTGYAQADVTEFARALTGLTVAGMGKGPVQKMLLQGAAPGESLFFDAIHEPGSRQLLGKNYGQSGKQQMAAILADLAAHPATAKHIATKLARHFVADEPPPALVARLEASFLKTGGDLPSLYRVLVEAPEAWVPTSAKFKSPWDWTVSTLRALNVRELPGKAQGVGALAQMGQPIWKPGSPAGFADNNAEWASGSALMRRVELADRFAERSANRVDARMLAPMILPDIVTKMTTEAIARAESPAQGLALLLMSPEFLRR